MLGEIGRDLRIDCAVSSRRDTRRIEALLHAVPLRKSGRHVLARDKIVLSIAGQRVGVIELVSVVIGLIECQLKSAVVERGD